MSEAPDLVLRPRRVLAWLLGTVALLVLGHAGATVAEFGFGRDHVLGFRRLLNFDGEGTIPAWYSSLLFLLPGLLCAAIARLRRRAGDRFHAHWLVLAAVFVFLALDEATAIHEQLIGAFRDEFSTSGALLHAWVIPYGIFVMALGILYVPFLRALPRRTRRLVIASAATFLAGAIVMEMVGGYVWDRHAVRGIPIIVIMAAEETLEMAGLAFFSYALLDFIAREHPDAALRAGPAREDARPGHAS
ncbi:MAG TPA: hypothetical protein VF037_09455 [Gemmatimonadales bacterium]